MESKVCSKCGEIRALDDFHKGRANCKRCGLAQHKAWRDGRTQEAKEDFRKRTLANYYKWKAGMSPEELLEFRRLATEKSAARNKRIKDVVYAAYGGYRCACCNESESMFLSLDHVDNNGYELRKEGKDGSGANLYSQLFMQHKRTGIWRSDIQVLCMNCQHGKARNGGVCPHKEGVTTIPQGSTVK